MSLVIPFYVKRPGSEEIGLAVSENFLTIPAAEGRSLYKPFLLVLWNENRAPEYVPVEELEWLSVPDVTDHEDALLDDLLTDDEGEEEEEPEAPEAPEPPPDSAEPTPLHQKQSPGS